MSGNDPRALRPERAEDIPVSTRRSLYPPPFDARVAGRSRRRLGEHFGLRNFGVNLARLEPGAASALLHNHSRQDEFIYVLQGTPTLVIDREEHLLQPGDCCGFPAGGAHHHLVNRTDGVVVYLEVGDRTAGDDVHYPDDDLVLERTADGGYVPKHKDGRPY
jgi:uncharacterized cupin superfamily protein